MVNQRNNNNKKETIKKLHFNEVSTKKKEPNKNYLGELTVCDILILIHECQK